MANLNTCERLQAALHLKIAEVKAGETWDGKPLDEKGRQIWREAIHDLVDQILAECTNTGD